MKIVKKNGQHREERKKNLRPQDKAPGLLGFHYTNILVNQLILLLFFPFVGIFAIYVQVKKC